MLTEKIIAHPWFSRRTAEYYRWYPKHLTPFNPGLFDISRSVIKGIYVHIPYCSEICTFCPYNKIRSDPSDCDDYVATLVKELELYRERIGQCGLEYVYFGGGTPSVLSVNQVGAILERIDSLFGLGRETEVSFEAHPTHLRRNYINSLKRLGVTRFSTGIQSFDGSRLKMMGATHGGEDSLAACRALSESTDNWGIDLLYRCQGQSLMDWEAELERCVEFGNIKHVSCYTLYLPDSSLQPSPQDDAAMASLAYEYLRSHGFDHYASCATGGFDFARKNYPGVYEKKHWEAPQEQYLGIGAGAFGYAGRFLTINHHNLKVYAETVDRAILPILSACETSALEEKHRYFVLGVKTMGINLQRYTELFSADPLVDFNAQISLLKEVGLVKIGVGTLELTEVGRFYVDQISEVFWSSEQKNIEHPETGTLKNLERRVRNESVLPPL
jgi:oxygen-independent coproporphyrinogen III oxidase